MKWGPMENPSPRDSRGEGPPHVQDLGWGPPFPHSFSMSQEKGAGGDPSCATWGRRPSLGDGLPLGDVARGAWWGAPSN